MSETIKSILTLQNEYNKKAEKYASMLIKQFDIRVDLTLLRLSFREAGQDFIEFEFTIFKQDLAFFELEKIDNQLIQIARNLELMNLKLGIF
jgi:hypothetical protein